MKLNHYAYLASCLKSELRFALRFALHARVHTLPRAFIALWQRKELRRSVAFAREHSPIYRDLWQAHGVRLGDVRSLGDIRKLPTTSKRLFKEHPPEKLLGDLSARSGEYVWKETSGSTGEPFRFPARASARRLTRERAFDEYRFLLWRGNPLHWIVDHAKIARVDEEQVPGELSITRAEFRKDPEAACEALLRYGADVMWGTPTSLLELAEYAARMPEELRPRPHFLVSTGEMLTSATRAYIGKLLGGEVYDSYGLKEIGIIGVECRAHEGFHIYEESILVEIVDEEGRALPPGTAGRIIVTGLGNNAALPFIRYESGDSGMFIDPPCPCGLPARRLSVRGRRGGMLTFGSKRIHRVEFEFAMDQFHASIMRYQLAKVGPLRAELRIVPAGGFSSAVSDEVRARFREQFGIIPHVMVVHVLPATSAGKTLAIIDETDRKTA